MQRLVTFYTHLFQVEEVKLSNFNENYCAGEPLANWLVDKLKANAFSAGRPHRVNFGWAFEAGKDKEKFSVEIITIEQPIEDGNAEWEVWVEKAESRFSFRKRNLSAFEEFCREIDDVLRKEPAISKITWEAPNLPK